MQCVLKDGVVLTRTVTLAPQKPHVTIKTRVENTSSEVQSVSPRAHPAFSLGDPRQCIVLALIGDGKWECFRLNSIQEEKEENELFLPDSWKDGGQWILWNSDLKIGILNRFDPSQVERLMLNWNIVQKRANIELWFQQARLSPASGATFEHSYEVINELPEHVEIKQ